MAKEQSTRRFQNKLLQAGAGLLIVVAVSGRCTATEEPAVLFPFQEKGMYGTEQEKRATSERTLRASVRVASSIVSF